jgi:tellurium resistance protein TerD
MTINLKKGQKISLKKAAPKLKAGLIGLGWDVSKSSSGADFDLDTAVFLLNDRDRLISDSHFVFYNNTKSPDPDGAVEYLGDNRTGAGEGDDEAIAINLPKIPDAVRKVVITASIYEGDERGQSFGQVQNAYIRLVNVETKDEVLRYDLTQEYSVETAMVMAELERQDDSWQMNAIGVGISGGLPALLEQYS